MTELTEKTDLFEDTVMMSVSDLAERCGVSKQAISKRVKRLVDLHNLTVERNAQGHVASVSVAEFENLTAQIGDSIKANGKAAPGAAPVAGSLDETRMQEAKIRIQRETLRLAQDLEQLVRVDEVEESLARLGGEISAVLDRMPNAADTLVAAHAAHGLMGMRKALSELSRDVRREIASLFARMASDAPETSDIDSFRPMMQAAE